MVIQKVYQLPVNPFHGLGKGLHLLTAIKEGPLISLLSLSLPHQFIKAQSIMTQLSSKIISGEEAEEGDTLVPFKNLSIKVIVAEGIL